VLDQEDADAVVGSPRGKQHISLVKCRVHHNTSKNDQADAEQPAVERPRFSAVRSNRVLAGPGLTSFLVLYAQVTQRD
jgi:hypothetical protein